MNTSPISEFCKKRKLSLSIRDAFSAYIRSIYADRFLLRSDTDTVRLVIGKMTQEQIENMWLEFTKELRNNLTE